ncbi:MAG TPA: hypothetical protein VFC46_12500, partial [Humisphaera sp.]|nr:hypothetical protein [Humisphaera sp.]
MQKPINLILIFLLLITTAEIVRGVGVSFWTQTNEDDFTAGTLENVVATNLGDLKLSRAVKTLLEDDPQISSVNVMAEAPDGTIYAGTGPHAVLLQIKEQKVSTVATIEDAAAILSLLVEKDGALILGTGGEAGRVLKIDKPGDKPHVLFQAEGVQYIWGLAQTADGNIYASTGPHGQLYEIKPDGSKRMTLQSNESNLLSLISDGKDTLYVGTDPHGLVYRVNRKSGESFVLYNAAESEVSALVLDKHGNLYAGTSEAKEEPNPAGPAEAGPEKNGRPEGGSTGVAIPSERPKEPTPPAPLPNPNPGQPAPIPKTQGSFQKIPSSPRASAIEIIRRHQVALARTSHHEPVLRDGAAFALELGNFLEGGRPRPPLQAENGGRGRPPSSRGSSSLADASSETAASTERVRQGGPYGGSVQMASLRGSDAPASVV